MLAPSPDFRALFESAPGLFLVLRPDPPLYTVVAVSDAYTRATMTRREEILGREGFELFSNIYPRGVIGKLDASLERVIQERVTDVMAAQKYDVRRPPENGGGFEQLWWSARNSPVLGPDGSLSYIIHRLEDVEEFLRLERRRAEWIAVVAHDLQQPLNAIAGFAQLLSLDRGGSIEEATSDGYVEHIRRASRRLARMIGDLLDTSRIEARRLTLECGEVDLPTLVRGAMERVPELAARCRVRVERDADARVWADADRVEQVLGNLLTNAVKYGEPRAPIGVAVVRDGGGLRVTVENRGPGISPGDLPRVFDRFERGCKAHKPGVSGLGLGLHISRGLVEAQGGRIWAESVPGSVTRFHFTLPLARKVCAVREICA